MKWHLAIAAIAIARAASADAPAVETFALRRCIDSARDGISEASVVAKQHCGDELDRWRTACLRMSPQPGFASRGAKCEQELKFVLERAQRRWADSRHNQQSAAPTPTDLAARFSKGMPLPGLPDMTKPVYVKSPALICRNPGALRNPNVAIVISIGACAVLEGASLRVLVHEPATAAGYVEAHYTRSVRISWDPVRQSSATRPGGWVDLGALENR